MDTGDIESGIDAVQTGSDVEAPAARLRRVLNQVRLALRLKNAVAPARNEQPPASEDKKRRDSFLDRYTAINTSTIASNHSRRGSRSESCCTDFLFVILPDGEFYFYWMIVLCFAVLYNYWLIMPRIAFQGLQEGNAAVFFVLDYLCDGIYVLDIAVQFHLGFLEEGMVVCEPKRLKRNYLGSFSIWVDIVTLLPLELLYFVVGVEPALRLPRLIKGFRLLPFPRIIETRLRYPFISRIAVLVHLLALCIHWDACFFFLVSRAEGLATDGWVYPETFNQSSVLLRYLFSFHWATLALTTIGDLPVPHTTGEFMFTIINYMLGVLMFATLVGQIGQIISNANEAHSEFEKLMDSTKRYLRKCGVPKSLQQRVTRWYDYSRKKGRLVDRGEGAALQYLPEKLKTEVALYANVATLQKVDLFKDIPPGLLHELVLKMKSVLFTPGDIVCQRGDIGREMFIVKDGKLAVTTDVGTLIVMLREGDYFGEISLLAVNDSNRRTANVYSVGYSELLVLTKYDLEEPFREHPEFKAALAERANIRLSQALEQQNAPQVDPESDPLLQNNWTGQLVVQPTPPLVGASTGSRRNTVMWLNEGSATGSFFWRGRESFSISTAHPMMSNSSDIRNSDQTPGADTPPSRPCSVFDGTNESNMLDEKSYFLRANRTSRRGTSTSLTGMPQHTVPGSLNESERRELYHSMKELETDNKERRTCPSDLEVEQFSSHNIPVVSVSHPNSGLSSHQRNRSVVVDHATSSSDRRVVNCSDEANGRHSDTGEPPNCANVEMFAVLVDHAEQAAVSKRSTNQSKHGSDLPSEASRRRLKSN